VNSGKRRAGNSRVFAPMARACPPIDAPSVANGAHAKKRAPGRALEGGGDRAAVKLPTARKKVGSLIRQPAVILRLKDNHI
jgi:hypothetical protein